MMRMASGSCQRATQRRGLVRFEGHTWPIWPPLEDQGAVIQLSDEHRERHGHLGLETNPDAELLILAVTMTLVVGVLVCTVVLVLHLL
jgi:hypothetical protein